MHNCSILISLCSQFGSRGSCPAVIEETANHYDVDCSSGNHGDHLYGGPEVNSLEVCLDDATIARLNGSKEFLRL